MKRTALALVLALSAIVLLLSGCGDDEQQARVDAFTIALLTDRLAESGVTWLCVMRADVVRGVPEKVAENPEKVAEELWDRIFTSEPSDRVLDWWTERLSVCVG